MRSRALAYVSMTAQLITDLAGARALDLASLPVRPEPPTVLMCPPDYFEVRDVKNAFMAGNIGAVDRQKAMAQWEALRDTFRRLGHDVVTIDPVPDREDMVFSANQALPGIGPDGIPYAVMSRMRHESRRLEVPHYRAWFARRGYRIIDLETPALFEGQGDALWHPGRQLLWGGYGHRTDIATYRELAQRLDTPIIALELPTEEFYHLDTCLCLLDERTALAYPKALSEEGMAILRALFPTVIEATDVEASRFFACNAACLDGRHVVIQKGVGELKRKLEAAGFEVVEVDTSEFIKSGGSVFCMKVAVY